MDARLRLIQQGRLCPAKETGAVFELLVSACAAGSTFCRARSAGLLTGASRALTDTPVRRPALCRATADRVQELARIFHTEATAAMKYPSQDPPVCACAARFLIHSKGRGLGS